MFLECKSTCFKKEGLLQILLFWTRFPTKKVAVPTKFCPKKLPSLIKWMLDKSFVLIPILKK